MDNGNGRSMNMGNSPAEEVAEDDEVDLNAAGESDYVQQQDSSTQTQSRSASPEPPELPAHFLINVPMIYLEAILDAGIQRMINIARPLSVQLRDEIPSIIMSNEDLNNKPVCTICCEYFQVEELVRKLSCDHIFHDNCIMPWLHENDTCPNCRKCLADAEDEEASEY